MVTFVHVRVNVRKLPTTPKEMQNIEKKIARILRKEFRKKKVDPMMIMSYGIIPEGNFKEIEIEVFNIQ